MRSRRQLHTGVFAVCFMALAWGGCGASSGEFDGSHPDYAKALTGSPAPLAAIHKQANRLLPGGEEAFERRVAALRGYPVVANVWASWCGGCIFEFPALQNLSARYGKRVAFLGIDSADSNDAASTFLREVPVSYPSYTDPHKELAESLGVSLGFPDTAFYNREGKLVYLKQGQYANQAALAADIRHYALQSG